MLNSIINAPLLYIMVGIVIFTVMLFAVLFAKKAYQRALDIGYTHSDLKRVIKSTIIASIVPSLAVMMGLFALATALGNAWPWLRLSVVGSITYELMAAETAAASMGVQLSQLSQVGITGFVTIMFVMTVGAVSGLIVLFFFGEKIHRGAIQLGKNKQSFGIVALECFMIGLLATFLPAVFTMGLDVVFTFLTSLIITLTLGVIVIKFKLTWLKDFILAIALIGGMASSILWVGWFGA